ncbi:MAG: hypothetical protein ACREFE_05745 [Limisphaerales bacterium]
MKPFMSLLRRAAVCCCWSFFLAIPAIVFGQTQTNYYSANGTEYPIVGSLPGDQMFPDAALNSSGGFVVWQDNITDGDGWGVSARRLDGTLSGVFDTFRVNQQGAGDQENPRVALLKNGGAAFVWQGGVKGFQHIYASFFNASNVLVNPADTNDISVSAFTNNFQINPAIATLNDGNVVIVWASFDQVSSNSLQDVYGQILSPDGQKVGGEFLINQFISYNQRTPTVAALANGGFVVAWVSEQERSTTPNWGSNTNDYVSDTRIIVPSVDIYARLYQSNGVAVTDEFLVNSDSNPCANPNVAAATDGTFMVAWGARDMANMAYGWDIYVRPFSSAGVGGTAVRVNTYVNGNQYAPRLTSIGADYLTIWTSLGQDGSREGVYGQFVHEDGSLVGVEFRANTTTASVQMEPVVASNGVGQFLVIWSGYSGGANSFDLFAQRYLNVSTLLLPMDAPFVYAPFTLSNNVYQPQLQVSWSPLLGISVSNFEIYVDGATIPMAIVTSNEWTMAVANGLTKNSTHSFAVDYVTTDGRRSPISQSSTNTTWSGYNWGGIPYEWMAEFYGDDITSWPSPSAPLTPGSPTLLQIFISGGNPLDPSTWLRTALVNTPQGLFLTWNPQPGFIYQVQVTTNLATWSNLGAPRFAAGGSDSIFVGGKPAGYYRVVLLH